LMLKLSSFGDFIDEDELDEIDQNEGQGVRRARAILRQVFSKKITKRITYVDAFVVGTLLVTLISLIQEITTDFDGFLEAEENGFALDLRSREFWSACLTLLFGIELALKLFALGAFRFADDLWNVFDSFCVTLSLIGVMELFSPKPSVLLTEARLMRLLRVIPGFRSVVGTAAAFAPAIGPSVSAILCIFYATAIMIVGLLGNVRLSPNDYKANDFRDFSAALITLFQLSIVNDWNATMQAFVTATGFESVRIFFVCWWAVSELMLYNTVTSLVLDGFEVRMKELNALNSERNTTHSGGLTGATYAPIVNVTNSPSANEAKQLSLLRSLSSDFGEGNRSTSRNKDDDEPVAPLLRGTSFTVGRLFLELFRDITEPTDHEVDIACWERGIHVGKSPYDRQTTTRGG
jgi:hypothetical protein